MLQRKIKVALVCHFRNKEMDQVLKPIKTRYEMAPWITGLIKLFHNKKEIELHVISPCDYLLKAHGNVIATQSHVRRMR